MRVLVLSALYPPVAFGGYEVECSAVAERLAERHEVLVLTSDRDRGRGARGAGERGDASFGAGGNGSAGKVVVEVRRELATLSPDERGALRAPLASLRAVEAARRALAWEPEMIYCWNGSSIPQAALRVLADSGVPLAFRVCEHWFGSLFTGDQFMRELLPAQRGPARALWATGARALNRLPSLRLDPTAPLRTAISWNSEAIKRMVDRPSFIEPVLERVGHSVPRHGERYERIVHAQAPAYGQLATRDLALQTAVSQPPEIVFLGRVTPYKGLEVAIEALALLRSTYDIAATLSVLGPEDSDYGSEMRSLAERLGVARSVRWHGQSAPDQVAQALASASAMIVPSTWDEPFPLVTIEGAFARVPLVASDVGGIGEGMHHEEHALLFARGDVAGAAVALARTLSDREQTDARVQRAFERAQALFQLGPYLDEQERFLADAHAALTQG